MDPLKIDVKELLKNEDVDAHFVLSHVAPWYFHQLGELKKTEHDLELFQSLVYRLKFLTDHQLGALSGLEVLHYPNSHLFEVSVLLDGTESWRYEQHKHSGGVHWIDQRLKDLPKKTHADRHHPRVADPDFEINQGPGYLSLVGMVIVSVVLVVFFIKKFKRPSHQRLD